MRGGPGYAVLAGLLWLVAGCATAPTGTPLPEIEPSLAVTPTSEAPPSPEGSGIWGEVISITLMGPGQDNLVSPARTAIGVYDEQNRLVARVESGADGTFWLALPPGEYVLRPELPLYAAFVEEQSVRVHQGQFTEVRIVYRIPLT